ncbi:hypothetical protein B1207_05180 [Legionella quinlivanii]|uniref:Fatty acid desaturase domain-containing protein n=1 Tax=Legionella quinlivanii TaxID=45073 RepID=A0A364LLK7_9GAMM|nr:fatty acid desaturase [Legionella quinlivanii]RAP37566.1 hypothetical protein B1207_05180 [Legionella quinlivanii]
MENIDVHKYIQIKCLRGAFEIILTLGLLILGIVILYEVILRNWWPLFILVIPLSFIFTRLFIIQHDLSHGNLFKRRKYNDWVGVFTGVILFTPYYYWQKAHIIHHGSGGNIDRRPWPGDIEVLSVSEYSAKSRWGKFVYYFYRNSFVMFLIGSLYIFIIDHRFFHKRKGFGRKERLSVIVTNIGIVLLYAPLIILGGTKFFLLAILIPQWLAGIMGIYLFYVQHNFKNRYFVSQKEWNLQDSALKGSSFYELPQPLLWLTANIGYHHIHTLIPRIPFYNLSQCHRDNHCFHHVTRLSLKDTKQLIALKLFDESQEQMLTWHEYKTKLNQSIKVG